MAKRIYKQKHIYRAQPDPVETRTNYYKEIVRDATPLPKTLEYKDIDEAFKKWVENDLEIVFENTKLPTLSLFSNQRFSEYLQSWQYTDENKNILMNFKTITRDNNPQLGKNQGGLWNIPGDRFYTMKRDEILNDNGKISYREYRMKQPKAVDLVYKISLVTNKYELLNEFNEIINDKFKARQCYIRPNGHYIPMVLESVSDESEYSLDDRTFFSQIYTITVMGYIITEKDFEVVDCPTVVFKGYEGLKNRGKRERPTVEIEEDGEIYRCVNGEPYTPYYYQPITLTITFKACSDDEVVFKLDCFLNVEKVEMKNILTHKILLNDEFFNEYDFNFMEFQEGDKFKIKVKREKLGEESKITIKGYNPKVIFDERLDDLEFKEGIIQKPLDLNAD